MTKDRAVVIAASALLLLAALVGRHLLGEWALAAIPVVVGLVVLLALVEVYRRTAGLIHRATSRLYKLDESRERDYRQIEALLSLLAALKPERPIPPTRGWAASPDFLRVASDLVFRMKPRLVVEAGSGVSTLILAYSLKRSGAGKVVSLEHDGEYAAQTRELIAEHGLDDVATVIHAPLKDIEIDGEAWPWYSLDGFEPDSPIDLLVIDGPPKAVRRHARYPALPLLKDRLAPGAAILLDDASRPDEQETVTRWTDEFADLDAEHLDLEKGACLLRTETHSPPE